MFPLDIFCCLDLPYVSVRKDAERRRALRLLEPHLDTSLSCVNLNGSLLQGTIGCTPNVRVPCT